MFALKAIAMILMIGAIAPAAVEATDPLGGILGGVLDLAGLDNLLKSLLGTSCSKDSILGAIGKIIEKILGCKITFVGDLLSSVIYSLCAFLKYTFDGIFNPSTCKVDQSVLVGLGSALIKIVLGIVYYLLCFLQSVIALIFGSKDACQICKGGLDISIGLGANISSDQCKAVIAQGYKECQAYWDVLGLGAILAKVEGLLKIILETIFKLLTLGKKCCNKDYQITCNDAVEAITHATTIVCACGDHYGDKGTGSGGLLIVVDNILKIFVNYGWNTDHIKTNISDCKNGDDVEHLKTYCNK